MFAVVFCWLMMRRRRDGAGSSLYFYLFVFAFLSSKEKACMTVRMKVEKLKIPASRFSFFGSEGGVFGLLLTKLVLGPDDPLVMTHWLAAIVVPCAIPRHPGQCISFVFLQTWRRWRCTSVPPAIGSATHPTVLYINVHYRCPSNGGKKEVYFAVMSHYCSFRAEVSCWQLQLSVK